MTIENPPIRIGISSCLLGQKVRYNGDHKRNPYIVDVLGKYFEWIPVCPEVEIGLGVPRDTLRLVKSASESPDTRLIVTKTDEDLTERMMAYASKRADELKSLMLHGYILKKGSPSCGLERVRLYSSNGISEKKGRGLFAEQLVRSLPILPIEEEGRLLDAVLRRNWIERVFAYYRLRQLMESDPTKKHIIHFHTRHKMQLLSHDRGIYTQLGQLVAQVNVVDSAWIDAYAAGFMKALAVHTTRKKHADVLYHLMGFLKKHITDIDKQELVDKIEAYRLGKIPRAVPITLLNHHYMHYPESWIQDQTYLDPYPEEMLMGD